MIGIVPACKVWIRPDRLAAHLIERNVLRRVMRRRRHRHRGEHAVWKTRGPFQHLHAAHRSADDAKQPLDAQLGHQHRLRPHHVGNRNGRKIRPPHRTVRAHRVRPRRSHAAAQHIAANDEKPVRIDRPSGPHQRIPPARLAGHRMRLGYILVAGQRMAHQHRVAARCVQRAIGPVRQIDRRQRLAAFERQPLRKMSALMLHAACV